MPSDQSDAAVGWRSVLACDMTVRCRRSRTALTASTCPSPSSARRSRRCCGGGGAAVRLTCNPLSVAHSLLAARRLRAGASPRVLSGSQTRKDRPGSERLRTGAPGVEPGLPMEPQPAPRLRWRGKAADILTHSRASGAVATAHGILRRDAAWCEELPACTSPDATRPARSALTRLSHLLSALWSARECC